MAPLLTDLTTDAHFRGPLLLVDAQEREAKNGSRFLDLKLRDRSSEINGKKWKSTPEEFAAIRGAQFVFVNAREESFQGRMQLRVETIEPYEPNAEELQQLIRASAWDASMLWGEVTAHLRHEITDDALWRLVDAALQDPDVQARAQRMAAASMNHHAYRSGLAEHILSMLRLGAQIVRHYENYYPIRIHRGLVAAGILFHDLGKIWELEGDIQASYTTEGRLLGHIFMAASWLQDLGQRTQAPRALVMELQHIVLSHHGQLEFGSPKRPKTLEAMVIHHIDKLDADMNHWMTELENTQDWTPWQRNYGRPLFRPDHIRESWAETPALPRPLRGPGCPVDADFHDDDARPHDKKKRRASSERAHVTNEIPRELSTKPARRGERGEHENPSITNNPPDDAKIPAADSDIKPSENDQGNLSLFDGLPLIPR